MKRELSPHGISMWRHFFDRERTADELTRSMIHWQEQWNWDFMKINPPACYHALAWGAEYEFFNDPFHEPELRKPVITTTEDVDKIQILDPTKGELGEQLKVIRNLRVYFGPELPMLETVFSPIEVAHRLLTGREALSSMWRRSPKAVHILLNRITKTFTQFCLKALDAGANGIFLATKWANKDLLTWEEYTELGTTYEMQMLNALNRRGAMIVLHVCGEHTYLENMLDYQVDAFSYDFFAKGALDPQNVIERSGKQVIGGIDPELLGKDPKSTADKCKKYHAIDRWIAGPSCVVPPGVSDQAIEEFLTHLAMDHPRF